MYFRIRFNEWTVQLSTVRWARMDQLGHMWLIMSTPFKGGRHIVLLRLASALALASGLTLRHPLLDFFLGALKYDPSTGAPKLINSDLFLEKRATVPIGTVARFSGTVARFSRNKSLLISFGAPVIPAI